MAIGTNQKHWLATRVGWHMLTKRYLVSVKNLPAILNQIRKGTAPELFNYEHLASLGFTSSNDRGVVPLLKDLGFLSENGAPTERYKEYRNEAESKRVMGEALLQAYSDLFHVSANPTDGDRGAIEGKFKASHNVTDKVAQLQAATFFTLLKQADLAAARKEAASLPVGPKLPVEPAEERVNPPREKVGVAVQIPLRYNIEIHLPPTKDIEVYHAIFRAIRENLGE